MGDKDRLKMFPKSKIWNVFEERHSLEQQRLKDLAGHGGNGDTVVTQVANLRSHFPHAEFTIVGTDVAKRGVAVSANANAIDFVVLFDQPLGDANWKAAPARNQADFFCMRGHDLCCVAVRVCNLWCRCLFGCRLLLVHQLADVAHESLELFPHFRQSR